MDPSEPQVASIEDLTDDLLIHTLLDAQLSVRDLLACACSCQRLSALLGSETSPVWHAVCQRWLHAEAAASGNGHAAPQADAVRKSLRLKGYRSMARGLLKLRHSPMGLWWMEAKNDSPMWDVSKGLLEVSITDQSNGAGPPHLCVMGCSKEWFETTEGVYSLLNKPLFSINLCPELDLNNDDTSSSASASSSADGPRSGKGSDGSSAGAGPSAPAGSSGAQPLRRRGTWGSSVDLAGGGGELPPDEHGVVVPSIELMHDCLALFRAEFQLRMPILPAHPPHPGAQAAQGALLDASPGAQPSSSDGDSDSGGGGGGGGAAAGPSTGHVNAPTAPPPPGVPRTRSLADNLLASLAFGGGSSSSGGGGAGGASQLRWGSPGGSPAHASSPTAAAAAGVSSRRVPQQGPEFSAALRFEAQGRCMILEVTVEWELPAEEQSPQRLPRRTVSSMAASGVRHTLDTLAALCTGAPRGGNGASLSSSPGSGSARPRRCKKTYALRFYRVEQLPGRASPARPLPPAPANSGCPADVWAQLHLVQGLWTAEYGSHGAEVVQVCIRSGDGNPDTTSTPMGPVPRLEGFKLVGDVNVPAGKLTFAADTTRCRAGRFDDRDVATGQEDHRPVLAFWGAGMGIVNMALRPVACRFAGVGQINEVPGIWAPQWEVAELILYHSEPGVLDHKVMSILWRDRGSLHLQLMDFMRFPVEGRDGWAVPGPEDGKNGSFMTHVHH